jgi:hypothetical protein
MRLLQHLRRFDLARLVLAWFVLSIGVAIASPVVQPQSLELVCSAAGSIKLVVHADDGVHDAGTAHLDCALCLPGGAPPALETAPTLPAPLPLGHALQPVESARIAAGTAAPPPARGPPVFSLS